MGKKAIGCNGCGRQVAARRISSGTLQCQRCIAKLPKSQCVSCRTSLVHLPGEAPECCNDCARRLAATGRPCNFCGTIVDERGVAFGDAAYCRTHKRHARPKRRCHYCGQEHTQINVSVAAGLAEPACPSCIRKHTPSCEVCKSKTAITGEVKGRAACTRCVERGTLLDGTCSKCGKHSKHPDTCHCPGCGYARLAKGRAVRLEIQATTDWMRQLVAEYLSDNGLDRNPLVASQALVRNIEGFLLLEGALSGPDELTTLNVLKAFEVDTTRKRFRSIKNWLTVKKGLDFKSPGADWYWHERNVRERLESENEPWIQSALTRFKAILYQRRAKFVEANARTSVTPIAPKSIELALRYAQMFLRYCAARGITSMEGFGQAEVDAFASKHFKVYQALGSFISFANSTTHRLARMSLPVKSPARSSVHNVIESKKKIELVQSWFSAKTDVDLRNSVIALLSFFYLQRLPKLLSLKRDAIAIDEHGVMSIKFGAQHVDIDPRIAKEVLRWLDRWQGTGRFVTQENCDYLFPGVSPDIAYSRRSFSAWLKLKHATLARRIFATGVHGFIDEGLNDPGLLVYLFGLRVGTAVRYWKDSGRDWVTDGAAVYIEQLKEQGLFGLNDL